ncbi:MAG: methylglutaconyl-CoA hydratase, partial [Chloroflexota bacterium]|nr:methylglutaconyl-CoA hydratase [Chloroflexota bacterium]
GNEQDAMAMADMFETIDTCPVPVIARVHGAALGGGVGLCAVADVVIAESGARFGFTETRLGVLPAVISPFVIAKIGESEARALFPGGRRFDAIRALRIGLVHEVVPAGEALARAMAIGEEIALRGPLAVREAKRLLDLASEVDLDAGLAAELDASERVFASEDMVEGATAFFDKRDPNYHGR